MFGTDTSLVLYLPLDAVENNHVKDSAGHTSAVQGHPTVAPDDRFGSVLALDGIDDFVDAGSDERLRITDAITVSAWVKHLGGNGHVVNVGGGWNDNGYSLFLYRGYVRVELQDTSRGHKIVSDHRLPTDGDWHHLAFTWDSAHRLIVTFIDGQPGTRQPQFTGPIGIASQSVRIGHNQARGNF